MQKRCHEEEKEMAMVSCSSGEYSWEARELEQGVFSCYVCKGLEGNAVDEKGVVTIDSIFKYAQLSVE